MLTSVACSTLQKQFIFFNYNYTFLIVAHMLSNPVSAILCNYFVKALIRRHEEYNLILSRALTIAPCIRHYDPILINYSVAFIHVLEDALVQVHTVSKRNKNNPFISKLLNSSICLDRNNIWNVRPWWPYLLCITYCLYWKIKINTRITHVRILVIVDQNPELYISPNFIFPKEIFDMTLELEIYRVLQIRWSFLQIPL